MSSHEPNWYWSQRGSTMGPIDLKEIRRLAATGSIEYSTWIFDPRAQAWLVAGSIDGVFMKPVPPVPTGPAAPPDATTDPTTDSTTDPNTDSTTDPKHEFQRRRIQARIDEQFVELICKLVSAHIARRGILSILRRANRATSATMHRVRPRQCNVANHRRAPCCRSNLSRERARRACAHGVSVHRTRDGVGTRFLESARSRRSKAHH